MKPYLHSENLCATCSTIDKRDSRSSPPLPLPSKKSILPCACYNENDRKLARYRKFCISKIVPKNLASEAINRRTVKVPSFQRSCTNAYVLKSGCSDPSMGPTHRPHSHVRHMASIGANEKRSRAAAWSVRTDWSLISSHNEGRLTVWRSAVAQGIFRLRYLSMHRVLLLPVRKRWPGSATRRTGDIKDSETRLINFLI